MSGGWPARCRIFTAPPSCDPALLERFAALATSVISDSLDRTGAVLGARMLGHGAVRPGRSMAGQALTVRMPAGDNLVLHQALELCGRGHVVVVDAGGGVDRAIAGEIMCRYASSRGAVGLVVDGAIRDVAAMAALPFWVFARGSVHLGPYKKGPGEINGPIAVGGTVVRTGDIVVGDADGVVVVAQDRAAEVVAAAEAAAEQERETMRQIEAGTYRPTWLADALELIWVDRPD